MVTVIFFSLSYLISACFNTEAVLYRWGKIWYYMIICVRKKNYEKLLFMPDKNNLIKISHVKMVWKILANIEMKCFSWTCGIDYLT